ncbi:hypothetical protein SVAN01_10135 [Stagonosporopsis vannaccii]|nr:hypothetical protein SVAN01_10135 [Stagonosporopsis vannaccii]
MTLAYPSTISASMVFPMPIVFVHKQASARAWCLVVLSGSSTCHLLSRSSQSFTFFFSLATEIQSPFLRQFVNPADVLIDSTLVYEPSTTYHKNDTATEPLQNPSDTSNDDSDVNEYHEQDEFNISLPLVADGDQAADLDVELHPKAFIADDDKNYHENRNYPEFGDDDEES